MEYKGYIAKVELDEEANILHGEVVNIRDVITFEGKTVDELKQAFHDSVQDYLELCAERGENPEKPYSGKFLVRMAPELHKALALEAQKRAQSINELVTEAISKNIQEEGPKAEISK